MMWRPRPRWPCKRQPVLGDDLALNAEQVAGVKANRELPVVWAVAKGSLMNKAILVPAALLISAFVPWLITPLLMLGGAFLCFEGVEKILEIFHQKNLTMCMRPWSMPTRRRTRGGTIVGEGRTRKADGPHGI